MEDKGDSEQGDIHAKAWLHRQNIQRYKALLRSSHHHESHSQIRSLLDEEEQKLRTIEAK